MSYRIERFENLLDADFIDINELKDVLWSGVPDDPNAFCIRAQCWQICLGISSFKKDSRHSAMLKRRKDYFDLVQRYYYIQNSSEVEHRVLRQIRVDIPRTSPSISIFSHPSVQKLMERNLYIWSIRHPACSYVQGINDLLTPFIYVFLQSIIGKKVLELSDIELLTEESIENVEADSYWCLSKVLANIQDNYTSGQQGIQRLITKLRDITKRIDNELYTHLSDQGIGFLQFAFRWMNCFLMRELPMYCIIRLWDTYIAESSGGFATFHVYVCAVFLTFWSNELKKMDFQQVMLFMQKFPTSSWGTKEIESLVAQAHILKTLFHSSPKHLS